MLFFNMKILKFLKSLKEFKIIIKLTKIVFKIIFFQFAFLLIYKIIFVLIN